MIQRLIFLLFRVWCWWKGGYSKLEQAESLIWEIRASKSCFTTFAVVDKIVILLLYCHSRLSILLNLKQILFTVILPKVSSISTLELPIPRAPSVRHVIEIHSAWRGREMFLLRTGLVCGLLKDRKERVSNQSTALLNRSQSDFEEKGTWKRVFRDTQQFCPGLYMSPYENDHPVWIRWNRIYNFHLICTDSNTSQ